MKRLSRKEEGLGLFVSIKKKERENEKTNEWIERCLGKGLRRRRDPERSRMILLGTVSQLGAAACFFHCDASH